MHVLFTRCHLWVPLYDDGYVTCTCTCTWDVHLPATHMRIPFQTGVVPNPALGIWVTVSTFIHKYLHMHTCKHTHTHTHTHTQTTRLDKRREQLQLRLTSLQSLETFVPVDPIEMIMCCVMNTNYWHSAYMYMNASIHTQKCTCAYTCTFNISTLSTHILHLYIHNYTHVHFLRWSP